MKFSKMMAMLDSVFINGFPSTDSEYLESSFRVNMGKIAQRPEISKLIFDKDGEPDMNWVCFLWWVSKNDAARINDALHGYIWSPEGEFGAIDGGSTLSKLIENDPIVRAERIKVKDYIKHINWVFHKTQDLPNIVVIGSDNVPERIHGLRNSKITLLDPKTILPKEKLFPDFMQRRRFNVVDTYDIFDVTNKVESRLIGTQNVFIIDGWQTSFNSFELEQRIQLSGNLLTEHGRCLFDIPMYGAATSSSRLFEIVQSFTNDQSRHIASNATVVDGYVHEVVTVVNQSAEGYHFEIEELKLTDVGLPQSIAMRVYLKKICDN